MIIQIPRSCRRPGTTTLAAALLFSAAALAQAGPTMRDENTGRSFCECSYHQGVWIDTSRCNGPVGEEAQCTAVLRFEGRNAEMRWPDGAREILEISEDGKSAVMKLHSEKVGWLPDKAYKRR